MKKVLFYFDKNLLIYFDNLYNIQNNRPVLEDFGVKTATGAIGGGISLLSPVAGMLGNNAVDCVYDEVKYRRTINKAGPYQCPIIKPRDKDNGAVLSTLGCFAESSLFDATGMFIGGKLFPNANEAVSPIIESGISSTLNFIKNGIVQLQPTQRDDACILIRKDLCEINTFNPQCLNRTNSPFIDIDSFKKHEGSCLLVR